jgi:hypothetical protein
VVVNGRNEERVASVVSEIQASGGLAAPAVADLTSEAGASTVAETATSTFRAVDILVKMRAERRSRAFNRGSSWMAMDDVRAGSGLDARLRCFLSATACRESAVGSEAGHHRTNSDGRRSERLGARSSVKSNVREEQSPCS